ncbi:hypothetical protein ACNOYE_20810 [Nannocystaceae bacterium ST9]
MSVRDWPPPESAVQAIHDRYQREVVEGLGLCPFARRSRELGRVHRPVFMIDPEHPEPERPLDPREVVDRLARLIDTHADVEIVLLTFPLPPGHAWLDVARFDRFLVELREVWQAQPRPRDFYMVAFHPGNATSSDRSLTADSLVPLLRRSPDPVIQCVDAAMLDRVRKQAQESARERMLRDLEARDPALAQLFARSISPDPELSGDIARQNFESLGDPGGLARLDAKIRELHLAREHAYGLGRDQTDDPTSLES